MKPHVLARIAVALSIGLSWFACAGLAAADAALPALHLALPETTVSGISSGAFMAVQFGVAHSATVRGVAATAGGPYFCAGQDSWGGAAAGRAVAHCMQGDPAYPARPISDGDLAQMTAAARAWSAQGLIDKVDNLSRQSIWLFHGYNDGIVKKAVSDALYRWYRGFAPPARIFYQDSLAAGHGQVSAACAETATSCQTCAATGGKFINACADGSPAAPLYDAAGSALQFFYGPLVRTDAKALKGELLRFDQRPYARKDGAAVAPIKVSMADAGYLYVPPDCAAGAVCRLHVAFHGCLQAAESVGMAFVAGAGYDEWADANRIVVLYPQAAASAAVPITPFNPQGCWDWWGYNDTLLDPAGRYATQDGLQIAAVWRMVERLASGAADAVLPAPAASAMPTAAVIDASAGAVALTWTAVAGADGYAVYRDGQRVAGNVDSAPLVDTGLAAQSRYTYTVRALIGGTEGAPSRPVAITTAAMPPACDPYYSLSLNHAVTRNNRPTARTCP